MWHIFSIYRSVASCTASHTFACFTQFTSALAYVQVDYYVGLLVFSFNLYGLEFQQTQLTLSQFYIGIANPFPVDTSYYINLYTYGTGAVVDFFQVGAIWPALQEESLNIFLLRILPIISREMVYRTSFNTFRCFYRCIYSSKVLTRCSLQHRQF